MLGYLLSPVLQIEDVNGLPLVNGKVYVYEANTSNLATIYSNYEGTLNTNPAILDLAGHTTIIADDEMMYDITVKDKDDNLLFSAKDVAVGGEGGSAIVSDVTVRASGNGISVAQSVENNTKVFTVSIDYNFVASKTDLNSKQNTLTPGANISISGDTISVTGLKTINVAAPLQKTETTSAINLSIDTSGIQTTLSAGTNIDEVKLSNGIVDLKHDNCSASINSIAIGQETVASGDYSFAAGYNTSAIGNVSHSEGGATLAVGECSHAEGGSTYAIGGCSHAEGGGTSAVGMYSHAEGAGTYAISGCSHAEGSRTSAFGDNSHTEGLGTLASQENSHAEGMNTSAVAVAAHAEGSNTIANGNYSHAEGSNTVASGEYSHAEGIRTVAVGKYSHAEGDRTTSQGERSHAEGNESLASGPFSHSEGTYTKAYGQASHTEGIQTSAFGYNSHAEGHYTLAAGYYSHAGGSQTIASGDAQTVIGKWNAPNTTDIFQIGCGTSNTNRKNAFEVKNDNTIVVGPSSIKLAAPSAPTSNYNHWSADAGGNTFLYANYQWNHKTGHSIKNSIIMGQANNFISPSASERFDNCIFMGQNPYMYSPNTSDTYRFEGNIIIGDNSISNAKDNSNYNTIIGQNCDFIGAGGASAHKFSYSNVIGYENNSYTDLSTTTIVGCNNDVGNPTQEIPNNNEVYALTIVGCGNYYKYDPNNASPSYGLMLGNYNGITNKGNYKTVTIGFDNALTGNCTYLIGESLTANDEGSYEDKIMKIGFGTCHLEIHSSGKIYKVVNGTKTQL